jgi:uncharacterized protein
MSVAFADTFFFLALLDTREPRHLDALAASRDGRLRLVTTEWVLTEFGDAYSDPKDRDDCVALYKAVFQNRRVKIIAADTRLFQRGIALFENRSDKKWSLTDCISFVVMHDEGILDALTGDHDFEQAGFNALLK